MAVAPHESQLTHKDYASPNDVRWCPGCGDYSILAQMKKALASMQLPREKVVFVSGIGCSSRFPYYLETYGFHSIHGRAPAVATGLKVMRPDLHVFVITGDGDGFSIGGNHMLHVMRRNLNLTILLFNNRIYGLTKGQYSPTSECGKKTKSTPYGSLDNPINPLSVAITAGATFVGRSIDTNVKHLAWMLEEAAKHKGLSFVEIYQNCNIFNDGAWEYAKDRKALADHIIELEHGKPLLYGKSSDKALRINSRFQMETATLNENGFTEADALVHDESRDDSTLAMMLSQLRHPDFPEPIGVFRRIERPTYEELAQEQVRQASASKPNGTLEGLLYSGETWRVE